MEDVPLLADEGSGLTGGEVSFGLLLLQHRFLNAAKHNNTSPKHNRLIANTQICQNLQKAILDTHGPNRSRKQ